MLVGIKLSCGTSGTILLLGEALRTCLLVESQVV
jgi:hypothetical protein